MAKQTFTTGQVLTAAQMTQLQQTAMLGGDANARTASYVLVAGDAGNAVTMSSTSATTITVNTGIFAAGDIVTIVNINTGVCTITAGTATVTTSGSLALAANQGGVLRFTSSSAAIFLQFATPASGDIEGITTGANSGLTGGVTSGTADLKVNFASKGQLAVGTGSGTTGFLNVGTNGYTIVADSAETTGLKWAAASSGGMTSLASGSLSGTAAVDLTSISGSYNTLIVFMYGVNTNGNACFLRLNADTGTNYQGFLTRFYNNAVNSGSYSSSYIHCAGDTTPDNDASGIVRIEIPMYAQTSGKKIVNVLSYFVTNSGYKTTANASYAYTGTTAAITQVNLLTGGGNWTAGNYVLYGVK